MIDRLYDLEILIKGRSGQEPRPEIATLFSESPFLDNDGEVRRTFRNLGVPRHLITAPNDHIAALLFGGLLNTEVTFDVKTGVYEGSHTVNPTNMGKDRSNTIFLVNGGRLVPVPSDKTVAQIRARRAHSTHVVRVVVEFFDKGQTTATMYGMRTVNRRAFITVEVIPESMIRSSGRSNQKTSGAFAQVSPGLSA